MSDDIQLSSKEIKLLKRMIGYDSRHRPKHDKYLAWRNYFGAVADSSNPELERLCSLGICEKKIYSEMIFHLTEKGANLLSKYLGVKVALR